MKAESKEYYIALLSLVLGLSLLTFILFSTFWFFIISSSKLLYLMLIPFGLGILGLAIPNQFVYLLKGIQFFQHKIGLLITFIILSIVFYFMLTPIAFLSKIFTKKKPANTASNFHSRNHQYIKQDLEKTW